jgi:hypothetical protein
MEGATAVEVAGEATEVRGVVGDPMAAPAVAGALMAAWGEVSGIIIIIAWARFADSFRAIAITTAATK